MPSNYYRHVYGSMAEGKLGMQRRPNNQKGNGFFGRIIRGSLAPIISSILPYLKDVALDGVGGIVSDMKAGKSIKEAAKKQLRNTSSTVISEMARRIKNPTPQTGSGLRKRKRRKRTGKAVRKSRQNRRKPLFKV